MKGNPYLGITVDSRELRDYIIRKHPEPLLRQGYCFSAYLSDGTPVYMSEPTLAELESRLCKGYPVKSIAYQIKEE